MSDELDRLLSMCLWCGKDKNDCTDLEHKLWPPEFGPLPSMKKNPVPQVPAMATSGASGQNVEADREVAPLKLDSSLCDERPAGGSNPVSTGSQSGMNNSGEGK